MPERKELDVLALKKLAEKGSPDELTIWKGDALEYVLVTPDTVLALIERLEKVEHQRNDAECDRTGAEAQLASLQNKARHLLEAMSAEDGRYGNPQEVAAELTAELGDKE
mgnify:CR=1 FL=1